MVPATPCELGTVVAYNGTGADAYLLVFDSATLPADGAPPAGTIMFPPVLVPAAAPTQSYSFEGILMTKGVSACLSSTATTKTLTAASNWFLIGCR